MRRFTIKSSILPKSKVVSFERDAGFFYRLSQKSMEKGDMAEGIYYLRKAASRAKGDSSYAIELARALSAVSQYDQSNLIYLKLLAKGVKEGKCCFGLSQNLYFLNDLEHSLYYLNLFMDKYSDGYYDDEEEEYIEIVEEDGEYNSFNIVYPPEKRDMGDMVNTAISYMKSGMLVKAENLLSTVPKGNPDYLYARNNMALCRFFLNDFASVKEYCDEVLSIDPDNVFALCTLTSMNYFLQKTAKTQHYRDRLLEIKTDDLTDLFKIATTLCEIREHELGLKYLKRLLSLKPYDTNIMFLTAIAYYNTGDIKASVDMFLEILRLNERNHAARYYLRLINQIAREGDVARGFFQPLEYVCQVPYGEMLSRIKAIKELTAKKVKEQIGDPQLLELCDWAFTLDDIKLQATVIKKLSALMNDSVVEFFKEKLIDPLVKYKAKELILENLMLKAVPPTYDVCVDYIIRKLSPIVEKPKREERPYYAAYVSAYVKLAMYFSDVNFDAALYRSYRKLLQRAKGISKLGGKNLVAAAIAYLSGKPSARARKNICKFFGVDQKSLSGCLKLLEA